MKAYVIAIINIVENTVESYGIYSEPSLTVRSPMTRVCAILAEGSGYDYEGAKRMVLDQIQAMYPTTDWATMLGENNDAKSI